jgi:hypothetical protein
MTPMTVVALPETWIDFPTTDGSPPIAPFPQLVTENRDSRAADAIFVCREVAALRRADAEDRKNVRVDVRSANALGRITVDCRRRLAVETNVRECGDARFPAFPFVVREPRLLEALPRAPHGDDALGLAVRQRREEHVFHDAEDRARGADA